MNTRNAFRFFALFSGLLMLGGLQAEQLVSPDHPDLLFSGRRETLASGAVRIAQPGTRVRMAFTGSSVALRMRNPKPENWVNVFLDGERVAKLRVTGDQVVYALATNLPPDKVHTVEVVKATEEFTGFLELEGFVLSDKGEVKPWPKPERRKIEFIGDSITCGYGIEAAGPDSHFQASEENFCDTYAWRTAWALDADYLVVARSGIGMLRNYNGPLEGSPDNLPAVYERTFLQQESPKWDSTRFAADVICVNLGTNDFSTKGVDGTAYEQAALRFARRLLALQPQARLLLLMGPMENRVELREHLQSVVDTLRTESEGRVSMFELSPQGKLGFGADYHPSSLQAERNGRELTAHLRELMGWE
jgi:hypothetical protein